MRSKRTTLSLGTISSGTLRLEDLIPALAGELARLRLTREERKTVREALTWLPPYDNEPADSLHDPEGAPLPGSRKVYEENPITPNGGEALTYEEYCKYYGNPDRHVVLGAILEEKCPTCGSWHDAPGMASLWGIDFMDDDKEAQYAGETVEGEDFGTLPGYLAEVVRDLMSEAGVKRG